MNPIPIVIDTDNSLGELGSEVDDAFALAAALGDPRLDLVAVTTVYGNTDLPAVTRLTRELLDGLGAAGVPIHPGAGRPLRRSLRPGILEAPDHSDAPLALGRCSRGRSGELSVIAIGPLTNLAMLLQRDREAADSIREIVVMGGVYLGTTGRSDLPGEFNFWNDPDAVAIVLDAGISLRLIGLDLTEQVRLHRDDAAALEAEGGLLGRFGAYARAWIDATARRRPGDTRAAESCAMHDALAVAAVAHPEWFDWAPAAVRIETESDLTRGVVVTDLLMTANPPAPNARIAVGVRVHEVKEWLLASLRRAASSAGQESESSAGVAGEE